MEDTADNDCLSRTQKHQLQTIANRDTAVLPDIDVLVHGREALLSALSHKGLGIEQTTRHLLTDLAPSFNASSISSRYYGFVTGGITPAARVGESLVSTFDQSPQVHLPNQTLATNVEARAVDLLLDLFDLPRSDWSGILTTGATAGNITGLALAREQVINEAVRRTDEHTEPTGAVGSLGLLKACRIAGIDNVTIFSTRPHSSLVKAASILGLGRESIVDVGDHHSGMHFDLAKLETAMIENSANSVFIVVVSCGEINTGFFATSGMEDMHDLRTLCDRYGAWLHVDGAFGLFARLLRDIPGYSEVAGGASGLELADSIAGDAHKLLNVPYDCGFSFHRGHGDLAENIFQNPRAAYLSAPGQSNDTIKSSLNAGLENSRRFRGLPVYATLTAYGRQGYQEMLIRQVQLARSIARFIFHHQKLELLPDNLTHDEKNIDKFVFMIVLFRAKDDKLNGKLVDQINQTSKMYVSGTVWNGAPASRIAIANWQANQNPDYAVVTETLNQIVDAWEKNNATSKITGSQ